jgi:hypothetical protein
MGLSGWIDLRFIQDARFSIRSIWTILDDAGFFEFFQPRYFEELDFPVVQSIRRRPKAVQRTSQVWLPGEYCIENACLTTTTYGGACLDRMETAEVDALASGRPGWFLTAYGNGRVTYRTRDGEVTGMVFRAIREHTMPAQMDTSETSLFGLGRPQNNDLTVEPQTEWRELLKIQISRQFSGANGGVRLGIIVDSRAYLMLGGTQHPNLPPELTRRNWDWLTNAVVGVARNMPSFGWIDVVLGDVLRVLPDDAIQANLMRILQSYIMHREPRTL